MNDEFCVNVGFIDSTSQLWQILLVLQHHRCELSHVEVVPQVLTSSCNVPLLLHQNYLGVTEELHIIRFETVLHHAGQNYDINVSDIYDTGISVFPGVLLTGLLWCCCRPAPCPWLLSLQAIRCPVPGPLSCGGTCPLENPR